MLGKNIDFDSLKQENFQLKNQITDLKNAFDLNRDILKILEEQVKQTNPQFRIFYQIISRLTGINNQTMLTNIELVQEKCKIQTEKKKIQLSHALLEERVEELVQSRYITNPNQIHFQMREEIRVLNSQVLALSEDCLRKQLQISRLQQIIQENENAEQKKPIIPSIVNQDSKKKDFAAHIDTIPIKNKTNQEVRYKIINKHLRSENKHLKLIIEQLEYRLTLLSRIYQIQPMQEREKELRAEEQCKKLTDNQLSLLLFALKNTELYEEDDNETIKLTITKRFEQFNEKRQKVVRSSSCSQLHC